MKRMIAFFCFFLSTFIFAEICIPGSDTLTARKAEFINIGKDSLKIISYRNIRATGNPVLLVTLHGDYNYPGYHYKFARLEAEKNANLVSVGILRPGYTDEMGNISSGEAGKANGDNYTRQVIDLIASAIIKLKTSFNARKTIIAGHSGGAAIAADLIGLYPKLADCAVLVSCPCILAEWRSHMYEMTNDSIWTESVKSISPSEIIDSIDIKTSIVLFAGDSDQVVPLAIIERFAGMLEKRLSNVELIKLHSKEHDIFLDEEVLNKINEIIQLK